MCIFEEIYFAVIAWVKVFAFYDNLIGDGVALDYCVLVSYFGRLNMEHVLQGLLYF
jgi:hypothetical protein